MVKIYDRYLRLKSIDSETLYLFKSGLFYIFLDEDAKSVSKLTLLKLTKYNNDIVKCGFPDNSLDRYLELFNNLGLRVRVIKENTLELDKLLDYIRKLDMSKVSNKECNVLLVRLKNLL